MSLDRYEHAFLRVCFDAAPSEVDLAALGDRTRYLLYRDMVRGRLREMAESAFPRTRSALGAERFAALFDEHLSVAPPASRYIREIVLPFASWLVGRVGEDASAQPWLRDLVTLERARWQAVWSDATGESAAGELDFDRPPVLGAVLELLALEHAVHVDPDERGGYEARPVWVIVHRRPADHVVGTFVVNAITAELFRAWARGDETLMASVQRIAAARDTAVDPKFIDGLCTVLSDFVERGIIVGSR